MARNESKYEKPVLKVIGRVEEITQRAQKGEMSDFRTGGRKSL